jgi:hypothetical protein
MFRAGPVISPVAALVVLRNSRRVPSFRGLLGRGLHLPPQTGGPGVKAGMALAKAQGKRTSRPPIPEVTRRKIAELYVQGVSIKRIAKELGTAYGTAWNYAKGARGSGWRPANGRPTRGSRQSRTGER